MWRTRLATRSVGVVKPCSIPQSVIFPVDHEPPPQHFFPWHRAADDSPLLAAMCRCQFWWMAACGAAPMFSRCKRLHFAATRAAAFCLFLLLWPS